MLGKRLKDMRTSIDKTQHEIADKINVELLTYGRYERGERTPSAETLKLLSKIFNCTTDFLLGLSDDPKEDLELTAEERLFLDVYTKAKESNKQAVKDMLKIIDNLLEGHE